MFADFGTWQSREWLTHVHPSRSYKVGSQMALVDLGTYTHTLVTSSDLRSVLDSGQLGLFCQPDSLLSGRFSVNPGRGVLEMAPVC